LTAAITRADFGVNGAGVPMGSEPSEAVRQPHRTAR
jgi:hypothetical protein